MKQLRLFAGILVFFGTLWTIQADDTPTAAETAKIEILMPGEARIKLKVEDKEVTTSGEKKVLITPKLEAGKKYTYKLDILIEPNNYTKIYRTKEITFKAGETVKVDFTKEDKKTDKIVVRWVPTPADIVDEMSRMAKVGKEDVIYDPGCGDAVMLIRPIKQFGAKKGIGIDIDQKMVDKAKQNAKDEEVADKVIIRKGDILNVDDMKDVKEATVVLLYIGDDLGARLEPVLKKTLKPGSRIVSHRFLLGDWKPKKTVKVRGVDGDEYVLHLWIVGEE